MTTYYTYDQDGKLASTSTDPLPPPPPPTVYPGISYFQEQGDVGAAYMANRYMMDSAFTFSGSNHPAPGFSMGMQSHGFNTQLLHSQSSQTCDSYSLSNQTVVCHPVSVGQTVFPSPSHQSHKPLKLDHIRHEHTLHSVLSHIPQYRRQHALEGKTFDVIEQETNNVFARSVPKRLLVLFFGRPVVQKFLITKEREDNINWKGLPLKQDLLLPRGVSSEIGMGILVSWMTQACTTFSVDEIHPLRAPHNTFAACSLAQTLALFGLLKDAHGMELAISSDHLKRPIFASELQTLWKHLGEHNKFTYAAIRNVGQVFAEHEAGNIRSLRWYEGMRDMIARFPSLEARVKDPEANENCRPLVGTEWMKKIG